MAKSTVANQASQPKQDKLWAVLSYLFILWLVPLWVIKPRNAYAVFHARQAFGLFLASIVAWALGIIPFIGWVLSPLLSLAILVLWIIGLVYAATGKMQMLPVVGKYFAQWFANL